MSKQKTKNIAKSRSDSITSEDSTETITASGSQEPHGPITDIEIRMKAYIDATIQATTASIVQNLRQYIDQQAATQQEWNTRLMETINQKFTQSE